MHCLATELFCLSVVPSAPPSAPPSRMGLTGVGRQQEGIVWIWWLILLHPRKVILVSRSLTPGCCASSRSWRKLQTTPPLESNHLTDLYRKEETIQVTGNGHVQSPRFPNSYPRNLLLTWRLHSQDKTRIQLAFDNQFGLEEAENDICRYDFVEVEDVSETSTVIRGRWCGHKEVPPRITSRTNQIKITFKSDDYFVAKPGFRIYYSFVKDFQPAEALDTNWESVTSSNSGVSYRSSSVTDSALTVEALDKKVAEFDTVEDLLKHFNPESWQDDLENLYLDTPHYRGRSYHERKSKGTEV
ncbi:platelet-derived growth factor D isoform X5 [Marmota marmota marmota]|uniref:platelet-derived growth factor D isoform X5 n=1 Tax=Marmota marmota marmota TaxID=9994 RepID=UPI0020937C29|nr:platelet-derived growth factor D isoform X5 [Marmota marmota marmota]